MGSKDKPRQEVRIVLADDHPIFRDGLIRLLEAKPELRVIGSAADGDDALRLVAELEPDILLRDLSASQPQATRKQFGLTPRELEIISVILGGYSNNDIAAKFAISEKTVKHHLTNIFDKLGVSNRLELALFALHHNLKVVAAP